MIWEEFKSEDYEMVSGGEIELDDGEEDGGGLRTSMSV